MIPVSQRIGRRGRLNATQLTALLNLYRDHPMTDKEASEAILREFGISMSAGNAARILIKIGARAKRPRSGRPEGRLPTPRRDALAREIEALRGAGLVAVGEWVTRTCEPAAPHA